MKTKMLYHLTIVSSFFSCDALLSSAKTTRMIRIAKREHTRRLKYTDKAEPMRMKVTIEPVKTKMIRRVPHV